MTRRSIQRRLRTSLAALTLGLGLNLGLVMPAARAAENLVFVSGAFRRSIQVADLEWLAKTGQPRGLLADVLRFSNQNPAEMATLLNQSIALPVSLMSRLLNTRIGEALLSRLAQVVFPLKAADVGLPALRSALVLGTVKGDGSLSAISFLRAYPTRDLQVDIPALLALIDKASSVSELVRFFSESPLDGLRNGSGDQPAQAEP
ncbi:MAG: alpha/beta hydrolase [Cyanobacteriota bacterium]